VQLGVWVLPSPSEKNYTDAWIRWLGVAPPQWSPAEFHGARPRMQGGRRNSSTTRLKHASSTTELAAPWTPLRLLRVLISLRWLCVLISLRSLRVLIPLLSVLRCGGFVC